jgi:hypothetical protein
MPRGAKWWSAAINSRRAGVDVSMIAGAPGRELQVRFNVLQGRVGHGGGVTQTLERGTPATRIDRTAASIVR